MTNSTLITGGVRSGKSSYALKLASTAKKPCYIATGVACDKEMVQRIEKHQQERGPHWVNIEEEIDIWDAIEKAHQQSADFIVVDCLGMWINNILFKEQDLNDSVSKICRSIEKSKIPIAIVTNEVGMGIVPEHRLAREFRDHLGFANQKIAAAVSQVILSVCGQSIILKDSSR